MGVPSKENAATFNRFVTYFKNQWILKVQSIEYLYNVYYVLYNTLIVYNHVSNFFFLLQEGPLNFSVYKELVRTTSAAESYNSILSSKIPKHGNFWKFLDVVLNEDFKKTTALKNSLDGTYGVFQRPKSNKYKKRSILIEKSIKNLDREKITLADFLNEITNNQNN